jgi:hypothetical protein
MAPMRGLAIGRQQPANEPRGASAGACRERPRTRRLRGAGLAATICAGLLIGCGSGAQKKEAQQLEGASILSGTAPLSQRLVKQSEIESASDSAAQRTFLQLWSVLQFGAWDEAEQFFQPGLRQAIGPAVLAQGLAQDLIVWQATKPRIVTAHVTGKTALITFLARDEKDNVMPASISFQRAAEAWRVSYFSLLDGAIQRAVQLRLQAQLEPLATKPSAEAIRQAASAAALQSAYLERQLRAAGTGGRGGAGAAR